MLMFLWITPIPPSLAIAIASSSSVTVSIAAETTGVLMRMFLENIELRSTSLGSTSEYKGTRSTSSKVSPSYNILSSKKDIGEGFKFCFANYEKFRDHNHSFFPAFIKTVSYTHLRAHETVLDLVCRLLLEKK